MTGGIKGGRRYMRRGAAFLLLLAGAVCAFCGCGAKKEGGGYPDHIDKPFDAYLAAECDVETFVVNLIHGGYSWNYKISEDEVQSTIADAMHPLDENCRMEEIVLPKGTKEAEYRLCIDHAPDRIVVTAWPLSDIGNADAASSEKTEYELADTLQESGEDAEQACGYVIPLHEGCVYVFCMIWDEEQLGTRGFCGKADYVVKTLPSEEEDAGGEELENPEDENTAGEELENPEDESTAGAELESPEGGQDGGGQIVECGGDPWGLTLAAEDVTRSGCTVVFSQSGGCPTGELMTGSYYVVEKKEGDEWVSLPFAVGDEVNIGWTDEGYILPMGEDREFVINWEWLYGELSDGTYRIGKDVMDFRETGDYDKEMYYAQFDIKESD